MSVFCIRFGHQKTGTDGASVGIINEYDVIREYGPYVIAGLKSQGHTVIDVTPPEADRSLYDSLIYGVDKSNYNKADYFVSLHANCVSVAARGCEVVYGSSKGSILAQNIVSEFVKLGFPKHQGAYKDQRGLAEIKKTDAVAVIVEPFFISSDKDVELYKKIGPETLGYAIVKGLTGQAVSVNNVSKGADKVNNIVIHGGGADQRAAEYLADHLKCPIVHKDNYQVSDIYNVFVVGGSWKPSDDAVLLTGTDRYETLRSVLKYVNKL